MKTKLTCLAVFILFSVGHARTETLCLSHIFSAGKGLLDKDGDGWPETVGWTIVLPDRPTAAQAALAADIAARANFECLAQEMNLVRSESEMAQFPVGQRFVFIGSNLKPVQDWIREHRPDFPPLDANQGAVALLGPKDESLAVIAGSDTALLKSGRAFFLRWPYFWEVWGREDGLTYFTLERDLASFLGAEGAPPDKILFRAAFYDFPPLASSKDAVRRLKFDSGEIRDLWVELYYSDRNNKNKAERALRSLENEQRRGSRTTLLNYPGIGRLTWILRHAGLESRLSLPRVGYPKRMLTPGYKDGERRLPPEKNFDLTTMFSSQGFYTDTNQDGLADGLESQVIIPQNLGARALSVLASKLVLETAGAAFPIVRLEDEVEEAKLLSAPLFVGESAFVRELIKTGKLKVPVLRPGFGAAVVVPKAFNKSNALTLLGADEAGLVSLLDYLGLIFPNFKDFGEGHPRLSDVSGDLEKFLGGEKASPEAFLWSSAEKVIRELGHKEFDSVAVEAFLPEPSPEFDSLLKTEIEKKLRPERLEFKVLDLKKPQLVFAKEKNLRWEADEALSLLEKNLPTFSPSSGRLEVSLGLSESPAVRVALKKEIETRLRQAGFPDFDVHVACAYKQGFFWLTETVLPRLRELPVSRLEIRFGEEMEDFSRPKRFYSEPLRWLQELYPADEILAAELGLPLEEIQLEKNRDSSAIYEVIALDKENRILLSDTFSPRTRQLLFLELLPEWGEVKVTTGWLTIRSDDGRTFDASLPTDLENFWEFYQEEVLSSLYAHVMKKTDHEPSSTKQPYFKRLKIELKLSEPDYRLGLDEEMVSSLEAIHDEIYFDTLDFLRGITKIELENLELPADTSRLSAPGNVFPLIHPSSEGKGGSVKVELEDWPAPSPQLIVRLKEKGRAEEVIRKFVFPVLRPKAVRFPSFIFDGNSGRIANLGVVVEFDKEEEYLALLEILQTRAELQKAGLPPRFPSYPGLESMNIQVRFKDLEKAETFIAEKAAPSSPEVIPPQAGSTIVPTETIISPEQALEIVRSLGEKALARSYIGGRSYEERPVPVVEIFTPQAKFVSLARLVSTKPTLFVSARQHANEVSSTNYILKFAELLTSPGRFSDFVKKTNFVLLPMENPDGAALAFELQKLTPFHSLHAGRYGSLGIDVGYQSAGAKRPFLPEAAVRKGLEEKWLPDIHLNLHGYPSHEWVQPFSGYSPYLFRDYWIPRGWFAYYRALRLPVYEKWKEAGDELRRQIAAKLQSKEEFRTSNEKFYRRYWRWAGRWQPHLNPLELHDGLSLFATRRSPVETKLSPRSQITYIEETPELMDETASGKWLAFLSEQGLAYLEAHAEYLSQAAHEVGRIEEETEDRIRLQFIRARPGKVEKR